MLLKPIIIIFLLASIGLNVAIFSNSYQRKPATLESQLSPIDEIVIMHTEGGLLQVSTLQTNEVFNATKPHHILGLDLGKTTTQIRVPATYTFHIALAPEWRVSVKGDQVTVIAPPVKPNLPVAIDTTRLERFAAGAWSFLTAESELDALQRSITPILAKKSASLSYIGLQREEARKTVKEFVGKWLLSQTRFKQVTIKHVNIFFADEPIASLADANVSPLNQIIQKTND
jgi:hypothetical protein